MDCLEKYREEYGREGKSINDIIETCCPSDFNYIGDPVYCNGKTNVDYSTCVACWQRKIHEKCTITDGCFAEDGYSPKLEDSTPRILDSGDRTEFESGAVRDMRVGKGRCDLLPLDVVSDIYCIFCDDSTRDAQMFLSLNKFMEDGEIDHLYDALNVVKMFDNSVSTMLLEVAKHFEEGAKKYGDNNWRKGIPVRCYIDSAIRHYLKWARGDKDEPHDRAFCWNIMCAIWTCIHKPELNEYSKEE